MTTSKSQPGVWADVYEIEQQRERRRVASLNSELSSVADILTNAAIPQLASPVEKAPVEAINVAASPAIPQPEAIPAEAAIPHDEASLSRYQRYEQQRRDSTKTQLNVRVSRELKTRLALQALKEGKAETELIVDILEAGLSSRGARNVASIDLMDEDKSHIVSEYSKYTGKPWTDKDNLEYAKIAHMPLEVRMIGLYNAFHRTKASSIGTFKYVAKVISQADEECRDGIYPDLQNYALQVRELIRRKYGR